MTADRNGAEEVRQHEMAARICVLENTISAEKDARKSLEVDLAAARSHVTTGIEARLHAVITEKEALVRENVTVKVKYLKTSPAWRINLGNIRSCCS